MARRLHWDFFFSFFLFFKFLGAKWQARARQSSKPFYHHGGGIGAAVAIHIIKDNSITFWPEQCVCHFQELKISDASKQADLGSRM